MKRHQSHHRPNSLDRRRLGSRSWCGALGSLIVGRLLDRVGMISIVMAFIISIPFVVLIGAVAMPEYLLMSTVFISGMCLLGGQIGLNALARSCRCHGSSSAPQSRGRAARSRCSPCRQWSQESPHARRNQSCGRAKCPGGVSVG